MRPRRVHTHYIVAAKHTTLAAAFSSRVPMCALEQRVAPLAERSSSSDGNRR